ncbi:thioesterase II family protein [Actinomadura rupiterrae]|uniref:thioesterase II family protein n=1 Tax=Actinomadura rupiterrae TaxID=559627 RepID=UPI0020A3F4AE|nr:alpha/beta fold hydrolase [Actinomadura rupiterrae]MCP2339572.1 surfactin synthase thioesterase subunit [Actinomadura rupiterrae]
MTWFRCVTGRPWAPLRLFCFPHAGGSAVFYRSWAEAVGPAVELHAVQYPGRADRIGDALIPDARRLAKLIAGALAQHADRPAVLFGHSMGALVAYETALLMQERGLPPAHLFVSGARAPQGWQDARRTISTLDDDGVVAEMVALGGSDADALTDPELRELVLPYVRNDFALVEAYEPAADAPKLDVPVTALVGDADRDVPVEQAGRWRDTTTADFALKVLPGGHFYLQQERDAVVREVLTRLQVPASGH